MLLNKHYEVEIKAAEDDDPEGTIIAYASVFGNVDLVGDRVREGAFTKSLRKWRESGDPIPIILDHQWGDVHAHIGVAQPKDVKQTKHGLLGKGLLDIKDNPIAAQVYKLLKRRSLKAFSFGYKVLQEELDDDGVNDLIELDLIEFGPTLKGANPEAGLVGVKTAVEALQVKGDDLRRRTEEAALDIATGGNRDRALRRAANLKDEAGNLVDAMVDGMLLRFADLGVLSEEQAKSVWSAAYVNDLPDSAFLYIAPGGDKDEDGKTTPRSLRYFPVRDADGKVDLPHVRNALSRIPQANIPDDAKSKAKAAAEKLLKDNSDDDDEKRAPVDDGDEDEVQDDQGPEKNTGKRDDPLLRQTRAARLALAMGEEPPSLPTPPKKKSVKAEDEPEPVVPGASAPAPIIIGGHPFYQQPGPIDEEAVVKAVMDRLGAKSVDPDEGEDGGDDDGEKSLRRRTEQAARDQIREKLPPAAEKSGKALESEVREALASAGSERWSSERVYVYLHDYDGDAKWAIYCVSANEIGGERKYVKVSYTIDSNGDAVLDANEVEVEQHTTFDPVKSGPPPAPYGMPLVWLNHAGAAPDQETIVKAVLDKLGKSDDDDESKRDPLRVRTEEAARDLIREQMPPAAKSTPSSEQTFDVDAIAEKVAEKLSERTDTSEVKKRRDEKSNGTKSGSRDPLRKRTEREALDLALGRPAQDVPDIAQPEPPKERKDAPDEKVLRRQTDKTALDLALGGFE